MPLTSDQIQSIAQERGDTVVPQGSTSNGVDNLKSAWGTSKAPDPANTPPAPNLGQDIGNEQLAGGQHIIDSVTKGASEIEKGINPQKPEDLLNIPVGIARAGAGAVAGAGQVIAAPITAGLQKLADVTGIHPMDAFWNQKDNPFVDKLKSAIQTNPDQTSLIGDTLNAVMTFLGAKGLDASTALKAPVSTAVSESGTALKQGVSNLATAGKEKVEDIVSTGTNKITGIFKGKTPEEILATPENKLQKLSPADRQVYFDTQRAEANASHEATQSKITEKSTQMEQQVKVESDKKISDLNSKTQNLVNQADRASIEETQGLKPKLVQSMGENSSTYRELVDKEIAQHVDTKVTPSELRSFVDSRFAEDPTKAAQIKSRLGITEPVQETSIPRKGELPTIQSEPPAEKPMTIGDIYNNTKTLRQDIGTAAKKGNRVFTPDEMATDNAISTLSDFMKSKGVDLSEANKFWSEYAPMRDKLVSSIQPFKPRGAETGTFNTFTNDIQDYVKGVNEGKVDFLSATEKLLGTKIGNSETRAALENLSANEKAKFMAEFEKQQKLSDIKSQKEQGINSSKETLNSKTSDIAKREAEVNRKATTRANVLKAFKWIGLTGLSLEELHRWTGI